MIAVLGGEGLHLRQMEGWRDDPNHGTGESINADGPSQDSWVRVKLVPPKTVHQDHNVLMARLGFLRCECPAKLWGRIQHGKDAGGSVQYTYQQWMAA